MFASLNNIINCCILAKFVQHAYRLCFSEKGSFFWKIDFRRIYNIHSRARYTQKYCKIISWIGTMYVVCYKSHSYSVTYCICHYQRELFTDLSKLGRKHEYQIIMSQTIYDKNKNNKWMNSMSREKKKWNGNIGNDNIDRYLVNLFSFHCRKEFTILRTSSQN